MTSSIMFSIVETKPDIVFATSVMSQFVKKPWPLAHQSSQNYLAIPQRLKRARNYLWWPKKAIGGKILRFRLGG